MNSKEVNWVYVRDKENGLTYEGFVVSFSENAAAHEIVLSDVKVYRYEDSVELYSVPSIYLSGTIGKFVIETAPGTKFR
jgi:hypothetical protein